jgi:hypothetical protein
VPVDWVDEEVHFLWDAEGEGLVWSKGGIPLQGLTGGGEMDAETLKTIRVGKFIQFINFKKFVTNTQWHL